MYRWGIRLGLWISLRCGLYFWWSRLVRALDWKYRGEVDVQLQAEGVLGVLHDQVWRPDPWWQAWDAVDWPRRFLARGRGDCDEFAACALSMGRHGLAWQGDHYFRAGLLTVVYAGGGHNVGLFRADRADGTRLYLHLGNWGAHGPYPSLEEAVRSISRERPLYGWRLTRADLRGCVALRIY